MNIFMIGGTGLLGCEAATQLIKMGHKVTSVALHLFLRVLLFLKK